MGWGELEVVLGGAEVSMMGLREGRMRSVGVRSVDIGIGSLLGLLLGFRGGMLGNWCGSVRVWRWWRTSGECGVVVGRVACRAGLGLRI